ncbi:MAG: DNA mismatch repair protein MutL [Myxococcales bacterium]
MAENRIHVLPDDLANQIAAGEVVERPLSVVKELLENAIDAGARRVIVTIGDGGRSLVQVTDDGWGMTRDDALLAVRRHATSKVRSVDDLRAISSLGFRGEALPSIASVSRFTITTRPHDEVVGTEIRIEGVTPDVRDAGCPAGTTVAVRDLFYNVPARLKFLRTVGTEMGHIGGVVTSFALCYPELHLRLLHNGRQVADHPPEKDLKARIYQVLGAETCRRLYEVYLDGDAWVSGFIAEPTYTRPDPTGLYVFVNGRVVRDKTVLRAVSAAYGGLIDRGRTPHGVLWIRVPPADVDVNVHPTKSEVRFVRSGVVFEAVQRACKLTLASTPWVTQDRVPDTGVRDGVRPGEPERRRGVFKPSSLTAALGRPQDARNLSLDFRPSYRAPDPGLERPGPRPVPPGPTRDTEPCAPPPAPSTSAAPGDGRFFSALAYVGQVRNTYLVCQTPDRLVLIDQHAAHERVAYERIKEQWAGRHMTPQRLLFPETIELSHAEALAVAEHGDTLRALGIELEPFGGTTFALQAVPEAIAGRDTRATVRDIVAELAATGSTRALDDRLDHIFATMACHSVVRAGDPMTADEVRRLLADMDRISYSANCPHGRPVLVPIPFGEIEKWFHRA